MKKRGISPLIATILLVGLVIVIALIVFNWITFLAQYKLDETGETIDIYSSSLDFDFECTNDVDNGKFKVLFHNEYDGPITSFVIVFDDGSIREVGKDEVYLNSFESKLEIYGGDDYLSTNNLRVIPQIQIGDELKTLNYKEVTKSCEGEIIDEGDNGESHTTPITSCEVIDFPGNYEITVDLEIENQKDCIVIDSDDVTLTCSEGRNISAETLGGQSQEFRASGIKVENSDNVILDLGDCIISNFYYGLWIVDSEGTQINEGVIGNTAQHGLIIGNYEFGPDRGSPNTIINGLSRTETMNLQSGLNIISVEIGSLNTEVNDLDLCGFVLYCSQVEGAEGTLSVSGSNNTLAYVEENSDYEDCEDVNLTEECSLGGCLTC